jgi:hypothetical protein
MLRIIFISVILLNSCNFYQQNDKKEATFIIIGAGGRMNQELNPYAQYLNQNGYKINIHSFDYYYGNDHELDVTDNCNGPKCNKDIKNTLNEQKFKNINYLIYQDLSNKPIVERMNSKNNINLSRYTFQVSANTYTGMCIKNIIAKSVKSKHKVIFIDSINCGDLSVLTKELFQKYKNEVIFIHSVHKNAQIIDDNLISMSNNLDCFNSKKNKFKYSCDKLTKDLDGEIFDSVVNLNTILKKKNLNSAKHRQEIIKSTLEVSGKIKYSNGVRSCINDKLNESKFTAIDNNFINSININ